MIIRHTYSKYITGEKRCKINVTELRNCLRKNIYIYIYIDSINMSGGKLKWLPND